MCSGTYTSDAKLVKYETEKNFRTIKKNEKEIKWNTCLFIYYKYQEI